jgi:flagellar operon protein (TIGR03826 family)
MLSAKLDNCKICGRLFLKDQIDCCLDCYQEMELEFDRVTKFLKSEQNRDATVEKVSKCTNVSIKHITNFILDGRIYAEDFPNLGYPCAYCGKLIKKQLLCNSCFENLSRDIVQSLRKDEYVNQILQKQKEHFNESQYWRLKKEK